jgi:hypothetical protein
MKITPVDITEMADGAPVRKADAQPYLAALGPDLWALIRTQPSPLVAARPIGTVPSPRRQRLAFRLRFADGRVLKGRRFDSEGQAARIERLSGYLDPRHFPRLVARRGAAILTEWVHGPVLTRAASGSDLLRQAGALQGALHRTALPADLVDQARERLGRWRPRLERDLVELMGWGGLDAGEADRILGLATRRAPGDAEVGLGHGDLCPENIVVLGDSLYVVDNESVLVHACDYDLARTWYRWPMTRVQRAAFVDGYRRDRDPGSFVKRRTYWTILVLVDAALFRLRAGAPGARQALDRLRALGRPATGRVARPTRGATR